MNRLASLTWAAGFGVLLVILGACSGNTHRIEQFPVTVSPGDNPQEKIAALEKDFSEARANAVPLLAPTWYQQALTSFTQAKHMRDTDNDLEAVFRKAAEAKIEIDRASIVAAESRKLAKEPLDARHRAILAQDAARKAGAVDLNRVREEFELADRGLVELTAAVEFNDMSTVQSKKPEVTAHYQRAERLALAKENLDRARRTIDEARLQGARSHAPQSFDIAQTTWNRANKMIMEEPMTRDEAARLGKEAEQYASRALRMTYEARNISEKRPEQIALGTDKQLSSKENEISQLSEQASELSAQADQGKSALEMDRRVAMVRNLFDRSEADVLRDGNRVIVRLKSVKFPSGKAELADKHEALMDKVKQALAALPAGRITVEGHTDSTGHPQFNEQLSQKRAETVKEYLVNNGVADSAKVEAVGKGSEEPIMANSTKEGRAANRRIDLTVDVGAVQTAE
jgi:OmpA-OmpF porin, OOP family